MNHTPTELPRHDSIAIDCSCGQRGNLYATEIGARWEFLTHVMQVTTEAAGWPGEVSVDYDEDYS